MSQVLPRSMGGRIGLLVVVALAAVAMAVAIFMLPTWRMDRALRRTQEIERTATLVPVIDVAPEPSRKAIIQAFGSPRHRYWTSSAPLVANTGMGEQERQLARRLRLLAQNRVRDPRIALVERNGEPADDRAQDLDPLPQAVEISAQLADGSWVNAAAPLTVSVIPTVDEWWRFMLAISLALLIVASAFAVRWIMRPLTALAEAADRVGRGEVVEPLTVTGPCEVARTVKAFNVMHYRLSRFVGDRLAMLAAISHDLRTPMRAARLRAEMIDDPEVKDAIVRALTEMHYITETTLSFARDETASEEPRMIDLASLIEAVADDLAATGQNIAIAGNDHLHYRCRPALMRRALSNLIGNATKYGKQARVALDFTDEHARIMIVDQGPGLPHARSPTVRLLSLTSPPRARSTGESV